MITRTVRADTMMQALAEVKRELGDEALVVSARQIPGGSPWQIWIKPKVEVVAIRLEAGEDAAGVLKKVQPDNGGKTVQHMVEKDLTRKNTGFPKPGDMAGPSQKKHKQQSSPGDGRSQPEREEPVQIDSRNADQSTNTAEPPEKNQSRQPLSNPKIDLLQQLGRDEGSDTLDIVQISDNAKLPVLQLPQLPWKTPATIHERPEGVWPLLEKKYNHLLNQGLEPELLKRVCQISADTLGYQAALDEKKVVEHLRRQLEAYVKVQRESSPVEHQVVCVVGPSGAGKTSFCAKLAVRYRQILKRSVAWVCADTVRTGSISEAKSYTEAINIPMRTAYTPQELEEAVEHFKDYDLVIVDTPACNPRNEQSVLETGALLTAVPNRVTWVVVPATAKEMDLINMVAVVNSFKPRALVATKLDETNSFGAVYNLAFRSQLPLAYFTRGAQAMDDLLPAAASRLAQAFFSERFD